MDNHIVEIQKNPLGGGIAFHTQKFKIFPAAFLQKEVGQTLGVAWRGGGGEDDGLAEILFPGKIQGKEIRGLFSPEATGENSNFIRGGKGGEAGRTLGKRGPGVHGASMDAGSGSPSGTSRHIPAL
jgi:hypothetical protein